MRKVFSGFSVLLILLVFTVAARAGQTLVIDNLQTQGKASRYTARIVEENGQRYLETQGPSPVFQSKSAVAMRGDGRLPSLTINEENGTLTLVYVGDGIDIPLEMHRFKADKQKGFVLEGLLYDWSRHQIRMRIAKDDWLVINEFQPGSELDTEGGYIDLLTGEPFPGIKENQPLETFEADRLAQVALHYYQNYRVPAKVIRFEDIFERLKLRDKPSDKGKVLGQYYSDVIIDEILDKGPEWSLVSIAGRQGYMMNKFLSIDALVHAWHPYSQHGVTMTGDKPLTLYSQPDFNSQQIQPLEEGIYLAVMGTVGEDFLHVALPDPRRDSGIFDTSLFKDNDEQIVYGFVSNRLVRYTDNFATCYVMTKSPKDKLHLREQPDLGSRSLGKYFFDVELYRLFDDHVINDGFERVRIGDQIGYMKDSLLSYRSAGNAGYLPPLSRTKKETNLLSQANKNADVVQTLAKGTRLQVLGTVGEYYHVKLSPTWDGVMGYVLQKNADKVGQAASAQVKIKDGAVMYELSVDKKWIPSALQKEEGLDNAKGLMGTVWTYIDSARGYTDVSFEYPSGHVFTMYFKSEDLTYDKGLEWD